MFLTTHFHLSAKTIADIYKSRWQVELFFKWIKQNLKVKSFRRNVTATCRYQTQLCHAPPAAIHVEAFRCVRLAAEVIGDANAFWHWTVSDDSAAKPATRTASTRSRSTVVTVSAQ